MLHCPQVLNEQYEELVFSEPVQSFFNRVTNYQPGQVHTPSGITAHFRHYALEVSHWETPSNEHMPIREEADC